MNSHAIEEVFAAPSPFDDVFADDLFEQGEVVDSFPIWTHCGRRIDLQARMLGWRPLALWQVIDDAEATFRGDDDAGWELEQSDRWREAPEVWINWRQVSPKVSP
jgi:hypothetical protein